MNLGQEKCVSKRLKSPRLGLQAAPGTVHQEPQSHNAAEQHQSSAPHSNGIPAVFIAQGES